MKIRNLILFVGCFLMLFFCTTSHAQENKDESLGLPGDNLNLYAVMKLFQESKTLEQFEKDMNDENSRINNLDLNGDGQIDYITVTDNVEGKTHAIVLQDAINEKEKQDVAVFYVKTDANNHVQIQLIGDEALYGKGYIIEPNSGARTSQTPNPGYLGNAEVVQEAPVVVESGNWPIVRFIFLPTYIGWHSPWYWGYYPNYWRPWHPLFWHAYWGYHYNMNIYYQRNFIHTSHFYDPRFREHYFANRRMIAPSVIRHRDEGFYKSTYSHPELRKEGSDQFKRLHPANLQQPATRSAAIQRSSNNSTRPAVSRAFNPSGNNSKAPIRQVTAREGPSVRQANVKPSNHTPVNNYANRPSNVRGTAQQSNVRQGSGSAVKTPVGKRSQGKPASKQNKAAPKREEKHEK